jgi:ubiquinone/menaquinone biosynthesis C-methylase UbiE
MKDHLHRFQYNEQERKKRQDPFKILKDIGLKSGMVFIDIGSNEGFFTIPATQIVGSKGHVYALDIDDVAIAKLSQKIDKLNIKNCLAMTANAEEFCFDQGIADILFLGTVLHDFKNPLKVLKNAKSMLKNNGTLINLDWQKKDMIIGPPPNIRFSTLKAQKLIEKAGLRVVSIEDYDQFYYLIKASK